MIEFCIIIYLLIGIIYCIYDWNKFYKYKYYKFKEKHEVQEPMVILYWLFIISLWPIKIIINICRKMKKYFYDQQRKGNKN